MSQKLAIVFDMDGLLIDSEPMYQRSWQEGVADFGFKLSDKINQSLIGLGNDDSEAVLFHEFGADFPMLKFRAQWQKRWSHILSEKGVPLKAGALALVQAADHLHIPFTLATSSEREKVHLCLESAGLLSYFKTMVCGPEVSRGKPAPDIYLRAAELLGIEAKDCIALEDSNNGMRAALAAGMTAIMVPDLKAPEADVAQAAFAIVQNLAAAQPLIWKLLHRE